MSQQHGDDTGSDATASVVGICSGSVRGSFDGEVHRFLGIPYAEPPSGERRFALPDPVAPWVGIRDATSYGATPQRRPFAEVTTIPEPSIPGDDTLSVNICTPDPAADVPFPVMVWIHGGGYIAGSPASPWYDGRSFARDGVVTVSISYRLGFDGFGCLPDRPANRGLFDVLLALQWVQENIHAFGGDPNRVAIAGQSAGGGLVMSLLAIPEAWPLFDRAIALSAVTPEISVNRARTVTAQLASSLGIPPDFDGFAAVDEEAIIDAQTLEQPAGSPPDPREVLRSFAHFGESLPFGPVVGLAPYETGLDAALSSGKTSEAPVLFGATRDEFAAIAIGSAAMLESMEPEEVLSAMGMAPHALPEYLADNQLDGSARAAGRLMSDLVVRGNIPVWARALEQQTWAYDFAWEDAPSGMAEHCFDLPFAFDLLDTDGVRAVLGPQPPHDIVDVLHSAIVRFVRGFDPGWETTGDLGTRALVLASETSVDPRAYAAAYSARHRETNGKERRDGHRPLS